MASNYLAVFLSSKVICEKDVFAKNDYFWPRSLLHISHACILHTAPSRYNCGSYICDNILKKFLNTKQTNKFVLTESTLNVFSALMQGSRSSQTKHVKKGWEYCAPKSQSSRSPHCCITCLTSASCHAQIVTPFTKYLLFMNIFIRKEWQYRAI